MEIFLTATGIVALWFSGIVITDSYQKGSYDRKKKGLIGRVVKLSPEFYEKNNVSKYGKIVSIYNDDPVKQKILEVSVQTFPTKKALLAARKMARLDYDKKYAIAQEQYKRMMLQYKKEEKDFKDGKNPMVGSGGGSMSSYNAFYGSASYMPTIPQPPREPRYDFYFDEGNWMEEHVFVVKKSLTQLMPRNFDLKTERLIKTINGTKKGGEKPKKVMRMPRIYKFALLAALVYLVWDFALNFNSIMNVLYTTIILHGK